MSDLEIDTEDMVSILYAFNVLPEGVIETELSLTIETSDLSWDDKKILENFNLQVKKIKLPISESQQKILSTSMLESLLNPINLYNPIYLAFPQIQKRAYARS